MSKIFKDTWKNPLTEAEVKFCVKDNKRYTSNLFFGFLHHLSEENCHRFESAMSSLSSTLEIDGVLYYFVDDLLTLIWHLEVPNYERNILRMFSSSGVGIIPLIDEVCKYKKPEGEYSKIFNETYCNLNKFLRVGGRPSCPELEK